jgi:hypothetical protein
LVMVGSEEDGPSIGSGDIIIWNGNMKLVVWVWCWGWGKRKATIMGIKTFTSHGLGPVAIWINTVYSIYKFNTFFFTGSLLDMSKKCCAQALAFRKLRSASLSPAWNDYCFWQWCDSSKWLSSVFYISASLTEIAILLFSWVAQSKEHQ